MLREELRPALPPGLDDNGATARADMHTSVRHGVSNRRGSGVDDSRVARVERQAKLVAASAESQVPVTEIEAEQVDVVAAHTNACSHGRRT
jgi:hypothetical protein